MPKRGKLFSSLGRAALSLVALGVLFWQVGTSGVIEAIRQADFELLGLAWAVFLLGIVVRAFRWRALLQGLGLRPPFTLLVRLYLVGGFFNAFLPSGFGGDVIRIVELGQDDVDRSAAAGTVLVDRGTGILSSMALGLLVLPFASALPAWLSIGFTAVAVVGLLGGGIILHGGLLRRISDRLPGPLSLTGDGPLAKVYAAVLGCGARAIWAALAISTGFNLLNIAVHWLCGRALGLDLSLAFYFVLVPLISLALVVPMSVGGLGPRDWVAQVLMASRVGSVLTAAWTLSLWAVTAAAGLVGGLIYLWQGVAGMVRRAPSSAHR
jgi:uncharacterized membrane protein YbhN (UPF0104 family)